MAKTRWAGAVLSRHPGALHRQLGIPQDTKIPKTLLARIQDADTGDVIKNPTKTGRPRYRVTRLMTQRTNLALTSGKFHHRRRGRIVY